MTNVFKKTGIAAAVAGALMAVSGGGQRCVPSGQVPQHLCRARLLAAQATPRRIWLGIPETECG